MVWLATLCVSAPATIGITAASSPTITVSTAINSMLRRLPCSPIRNRSASVVGPPRIQQRFEDGGTPVQLAVHAAASTG